jgi:hypothetical protein
MGQQADNLFVLQIDPATGGFRQFVSEVPKSNYPTATLMSRSGRLYVGAAYAGHLLCFDPDEDAFLDLGAIHPEAAVFPCRMDEDSDGRVWIGSFGTADLTSYDPTSRQFTRHGPMDDVDMYNYPFVNTDGTIACKIGVTQPHVTVFAPRTGRRKVVGPVATKGEDTLDLCRGIDGRLYIGSSLGNFRLEGMEAVTVGAVPACAPEPALADGSTFAFADGPEQLNRKLEVREPDGSTRTLELGYRAEGTEIFCLHCGPDECLYGSSVMPLHLFRYEPSGGGLADLGQCSLAGGEAYSMANMDGKMYISSYGGARLSEYDPSRTYHFGCDPGDNPRDLGRMDDISCRPRSTLGGPLGRVWTASMPDYGLWGGPLSWYDPRTGQKGAYHRTCGDASCYTLAWLPELRLIAVGTSIEGGTGTRPKVDRAVLFLWDYEGEKKVWEGTVDGPVEVINALVAWPDGRLFGTLIGGDGRAELFVFDVACREFTERRQLPRGRPLDLGLQIGQGGRIYGFTASCIYCLDARSLSVEEIVREEGGFTVPGPMMGRDIYFATGHRLRSATIL